MPRTLLNAALLATVLPTLAFASVSWTGDFSTGDLSQWKGKQAVSADRLQVVPADTNPSGSKYMLRTLVKQGDNPINASGNRNEVLNPTYSHEGQEAYYRWQTKFDPSFPSAHTWQLFTQWHQKADCCGSPPIQFYVNGENILLTLGTTENEVWHTALQRGDWHDFVLHVKFSDDPKVGFLELWYDGAPVLKKTYGLTMAEDYLKMGLYRSTTVAEDGIVFHTGMTMGDSYEDVVPPAANPVAQVPAPVPPSTVDTAPATGSGTGTATTPVASNTTPTTTAPPPTTTPTTGGTGTSSSGMNLGGNSGSGAGQAGCSASGSPGTFAGIGLALVGLAMLRRRKPAPVTVRARRAGK